MQPVFLLKRSSLLENLSYIHSIVHCSVQAGKKEMNLSQKIDTEIEQLHLISVTPRQSLPCSQRSVLRHLFIGVNVRPPNKCVTVRAASLGSSWMLWCWVPPVGMQQLQHGAADSRVPLD